MDANGDTRHDQTMRSLGVLVLRFTVGGYLAVHGAQKLFGSFGGYGIEGTGGFFDNIGLKPGRHLAALAGMTEFGGGVLTATGIAHPLGPAATAGAMAVATATHLPKGPLAATGGYELPLTNLAALVALASMSPGPLRLGPRLSPKLTGATLAATVVISGVLVRQVLMAQRAPEPASATTEPATTEPATDSTSS